MLLYSYKGMKQVQIDGTTVNTAHERHPFEPGK